MEANLFTSIDVIGTDDRFAPRHSVRVPAERKTSLRMVPPAGDPTVRIGALRREWPACLADAQQMARFQASPYRLEREGGGLCAPRAAVQKHECRFGSTQHLLYRGGRNATENDSTFV